MVFSRQRVTRRNTRRYGILLSLLAVLVLLLAACGGGSAPAAEAPAAEAPAAEAPAADAPATEEPATEEAEAPAAAEEEAALGSTLIGEIEGPMIITDEAAFPTEFNEAPMLAEMVAAGELPALAERLPAAIENLLVIEPVHEIGKYGGIWRRGFTGPADGQNGHRVAGGDRFLFWNSENFPEMTPNVAKSWEVSEDGAEITLHLREGMKWSDGEPFTTADVMFWYRAHVPERRDWCPCARPSSTSTTAPRWKRWTTTRSSSPSPLPTASSWKCWAAPSTSLAVRPSLATRAMGGFAPAHYLEQFHPDFVAQEDLDAMVADEGFDNWVNLFKDKNTWQRNPDLPVVTPWKTVNPITTDNWVLERNPYYFGVDTAGNQLPYIDQISMTLAEDLEVLNLRAIAGEYDYQARHVSLANLPVLLENAADGGYSVHLDPAQHGADGAIMINQSYRRRIEEIAKWLQNADFRRALSLGIDRDAINEVVFLGIGTPGSAVVAESSPFNPGPEYRAALVHPGPGPGQRTVGFHRPDREGRRRLPPAHRQRRAAGAGDQPDPGLHPVHPDRRADHSRLGRHRHLPQCRRVGTRPGRAASCRQRTADVLLAE